MKKIVVLFTVLAFFASCSSTEQKSTKLIDYVDPIIGTDWHGHVFIGASVPFGAVQLGPVNLTKGWDWCSGYHYSDSTIVGFAHTHLSGTGCADLGDLIFMPVHGETPINKGTLEDIDGGYLSKFSHDKEVAHPNYYSVMLDKYDIKAELTSAPRTGMHRYTYPAGSKKNTIIVDLETNIGDDTNVRASIRKVGDNKIEGYRHTNGWAPEQFFFYAAEFSDPIESIVIYDGDKIIEEGVEGATIRAFITFGDAGHSERVVKAKAGISAVSEVNAKANYEADITDWDFDAVTKKAENLWEDQLQRITVKGKNNTDLRAFYTAMYHASIFPCLFNDVNGDYRGADGKVHNDEQDIYTVYSFWDTYRATHPLFTIIDTKRTADYVNNIIKIYEQQGKVPVWHLVGAETDCMVGFHSIPVVADAYLKGIQGFDVEKAYGAIKAYADLNERGLDYVRTNEFIPAEKEPESVAKALEYAIDDWGIAHMAQRMGNEEDYQHFLKRSKYYTHYFDKNTNFMRGKKSDGNWVTPFSPIASAHRQNDYCEGNAWQYTWLVPQDVEGLIGLFGSEEAFVTKLDSLYIIDSDLGEGASVDISGMVGQYAQGNEPNHSTPFLYNYVGQQYKTAALTRNIMKTFFTDAPDGLCGNEDCGQMSAWYILTSVGFYPVNSMNGAFALASPLFDEAEFHLESGKKFKVKAINNSDANIYIQSATLNGQPYTKSYITYKDIMAGGELVLTMSAEANKEFGAAVEDRPKSIVY